MVDSAVRGSKKLAGMKVNDVVVVRDAKGGIVRYGVVKKMTGLGYVVEDQFYDFSGASHTNTTTIAPASKEEQLVHRIKTTSGRIWIGLGLQELERIVDLLEKGTK